MAFALKSLTAAVASAVFLSSAAGAAGLGKLTVLSALGQPLRAEIELTTTAGEDASGLAVKLASPDAFRAANIEFNPALLSLRFNVEQRGGRPIIRVTSTQPLNEPFVDMLLELSWNSGRLVREYTFLLDPAELRATQPAQVAAAESQRSQAAPAQQAPAAAAQPRAQEPARRAAQPPAASEAASTYRVRPGDTLGRIATKIKPADISLDMMLVALYRANPDAFIGNNMNRLKAGQILSVPDSQTIRGTGEGEARGVVVAHAADFNAYRNKLAGQVATAAPARTPQAGQSATGKITAKVEERSSAAKESQDQLRLSKAVPGAAARQQGATASVEDTIAKEKELAQAQARVKELEKNVSELENLMTVKSRQGSEAQGAAAGAAAGVAAGKAADKPRADKPLADKPDAAGEPAPAAKPAKPAKPKAKKAAPPPEKSLADTIMDNIQYIAAGAAVLLLAGLGLSRRRKGQGKGVKPETIDKSAVAEPSVPGAPAAAAHSLFAETGGQSVDTNNSVFNSSFAPSASQLDTNEVDPVAEADVYIAYGRDAQAEEILKEALRVHPERHAVRIKLLEIYAARKDLRAFEMQARELHGLTGGQGEEWAQAAALGLSIDPQNPLYAGAAPASGAVPSAQERSQQSMLSQQLEDSFRSGSPVAAAALAGGAAGAAALHAGAQDEATATPDNAEAARAEDNTLDFDLGGLSFEPVTDSGATAAPSLDEKPAVEATAIPDLEFGLDSLEPAAPSPELGATAPQEPAKADESFDLAFDMNFDAPGEPAAAPAAAEPAPVAEEDDFMLDLSPAAATPVVDMSDLAREFGDLPPLPGTPQESAPAAAQDELKDPLFDLDAMDFGSPAPAAPAPAAIEEVPAIRQDAVAAASEDPLFDLDTMDFGQPAAPAVPQAPAADLEDDPFALPELSEAAPAQQATPSPGVPVAPQFDMSDIDLDLPQAAEPAATLPELDIADTGAPQAQPESAVDAMSPEHMEMETKLDLAIAYQEIGDKEGARELLDEVIKGGNSEQVSKASAMREQLA